MKNKYVKSVAIIVFIFIIVGVIIFEVFKENNNLENISEETSIEIMKIVGIEESKSFKPIYLKSYIGDFRDNSTNGYELKNRRNNMKITITNGQAVYTCPFFYKKV